VLAEYTFKQEILIYVKLRILIRAREQVADAVQDSSVSVLFYKIELAAAVFDGDESAVVGDC